MTVGGIGPLDAPGASDVSSGAPPREAPLRLAFVLWKGDVGGAETLSVALAHALRASGHDARVVVLETADPLTARLTEARVPFVELELSRGRAVLPHARRFARTVAASGADGAVLVSGGYLALALRLGGYRGRIAAVEHGVVLQTSRMPLRSRLVRALDRRMGARAVDVHVAVSDFLRRRIEPGSRRPVVTIPNGVDLDLYRPSPSPKPGDQFVIGCMSRLVPGKGVEDVIAGARALLLEGARLRIAGDGPELSRLDQLAREGGVRENVEFLGLVTGASDVSAFWNSCDVAIAAPNDWVESFGLSAVEAMACEKPVVATRNGALPEAVLDGRTGVVVERRDVNGLEAALRAYRGDPSLKHAHGAAARERCERHYDIGICAEAYAGLFRRDGFAAAASAAGDGDAESPRS